MAKVTKKVARKDYPQFGIKKGQEYFEWTVGFRGRPQKSLTYPKRSQTTSNEANATVWDIYDAGAPTNSDDMHSAADSLREAAQIDQEKFDNLPENFQNGENGQRLEERVSNIESAADELDTIADALAEGEGEEAKKNVGTLEYFNWDEKLGQYVIDDEALQQAFHETEPDLP